MPSPWPPASSLLLPCLILLVLWARPAHAFGAGNIASTSRIEGQNWRHGDIEDTLLTLLVSRAANKKFSKMDVKRVYFGNWLRDYSQAVDVGTLKMVSADAIRILLWVLGFMSFGYGTKEFEVTTERLGCYRPEEHIDNPKDYADNLDARQYDRRLRGPVDERRELSVDERTGLKNYIASEDMGITTSAGMVRDLLRKVVDLGRRYKRSGNKNEFYEALRLLGTSLHCLEDYAAHSNYTELALIELGERDIFPHVGRRTEVNIQGARGPVYPIVTGTFGGVDFLHSVMGELSDKATQSEVQELEGAISSSQYQQNDDSILKDLLSQLPSGLFGNKDEGNKADELKQNATAAQMQNTHISPRDPEAWTLQLQETCKQIYPIMEYHDEIMQSLTETIEKIPVLPDLIEQIQDQINVFVFSLLAPFVLPIIKQVKNELATGSSEVIQSSREKQHIVFNDDYSTDPTHSMISKDHFSNILNEPAGKIASQTVKWVVPQIVDLWDDERGDAERTIQRIINGVFHHPALRQYGDDGAGDCRQFMFRVVEEWWNEKDERERDGLRDQLSRDGVYEGRNHKEGVHDNGHGCGKPLGMTKLPSSGSSGASGLLGALSGGGQSGGRSSTEQHIADQFGKAAGEAVGGGALGGLIGGLVGGVGSGLLSGGFGDDEKKSHKSESYNDDGSYTKSYGESGYHRDEGGRGERYGQAEYQETTYSSGVRREEYSSYEKTTSHGGEYQSESRHHSSKYERESGDEEDEYKKERRRREKEEKKHHKKYDDEGGSGDERRYRKKSDDEESGEEKKYKKKHHEHKRRSGERYGESGESGGGSSGYGGGGYEERPSHGRRDEEGYGGGSSYGQQSYGQQSYGSSGGYGDRSRDEGGYGRSQGYGDNSGYEERPSHGRGGEYGGRDEYSRGDEYGRRQERQEEEYEERDSYGNRRGGGGGYGGGY